MKVLLSGVLITLALFGGVSAYAGSMEEQSELNEISTTALEEFFLETKASLDLNDQQVEAVRPILQSSFQARIVSSKRTVSISRAESLRPRSLGFAR